jgi:hypothetical protein
MTHQDPNQPAAPPPRASDDTPTVSWTPPSNQPVDDSPPPVAEPVRTERRASRLRWGIALLVTALVVAGGIAAVVLLTGQKAPSTVAGYAPVGGTAYGELRLDMPGDQKQQLGQFLSKFPGFADQSTLDVKLDDVLDRVIRAASDDRQDWTTKIKPWFGGQLGFSVGQLPPPDAPEAARGLLILSITDADRARAWFDEVSADLPRSETNHQNVPLTVFGQDGKSGAMAIHDGRMMLIGDEASVRSAIDTGGRSAFSTEGGLPDALAAIDGADLGYVFLDTASYGAWLNDAAEAMPGGSALPISELSAELLPDWLLLRLQARGDALAFEAVMPHIESLSAAGDNRAGVLAGHVPPSTFLLVEGHEVGASIREWIDVARQDPDAAQAIAAFEQQVALIGGLDGLIGWMGDGAIALARDGAELTGGLVLQPKDAAGAERLLGVLRAGLELAGAAQGITVRDEDYNGTTITIYDLGDLASLGQMFGAAAGLPPGVEPPSGRLELSVVSTEQVVAISASPAFARAVIDAGSGASLADDARYQGLIARVGAQNVGSSFTDVTAIRELIEGAAGQSPEALAAYERDVKPYLLPLDAIVQGTVRDGDLDRTTTVVVVK